MRTRLFSDKNVYRFTIHHLRKEHRARQSYRIRIRTRYKRRARLRSFQGAPSGLFISAINGILIS